MKIEIGKTYTNKTRKLLVPCLNSYSEVFLNFYNSLYKLAYGIHDTLLDGSPLIEGNNLFILFDVTFKTDLFYEFLEWIQDQEYYTADYSLDINLNNPEKHMIVIKIPEVHNEDYKNFLLGMYSKMYTKEFRKKHFIDRGRIYEYAVLTKEFSFIPNLMQDIKKEFDTEVEVEDLIGKEIMLPLKRTEEVFNCKKNQRVFFNEELDKVWQHQN